METIDYLKFYNDEKYLLNEVGPEFRASGQVSAVDFYMILGWKANRAKTKHKTRLANLAGSFSNAVQQIAEGLHAAADNKSRLELLMTKWSFLLPTATAILALLYPDDFTVYDWRVREEVQSPLKADRTFSESLWTDYEAFKQAVIAHTPHGLSLRERDQFLIGRSLRREIEAALAE